ncbi:hypothetical protein P154DRAFT_217994 [Amniculicola lignicola CBS 123094]|uniref:Uncharacterized protein n=1 Tax=Amniculicola lignicola CBS 123094 TaxID=1392246 RepID=A0A6A5WZ74_9PLEO|nr:hypothetical protein P154DRAFT_217994 [Amniculicola lignicola CBS 123094]
MPNYHATGIRMRLGTASLADTLTHNLTNNSGELAAKNTKAAEDKLQAGELMKETSVAFPGNTDGLSVNFLGPTPFLQVQTGADVFVKAPSTEPMERRTRRTSSMDVPDYMVPKALFLTVSLSEKAYLRSFDDDKKQSVMVEVLFNGMLTHSLLLNKNKPETPAGMKTLDLIFTGLRSERLAERPWIIIPPGQNADGSLRGLRAMPTPRKRWEQISETLLEEAELRGVNERYERPPSGAYLEALATMQMPDEVENMQKASGHRFGVIDVIVTVGGGSKNSPQYLTAPVRLLDSRYKKTSTEIKMLEIVTRNPPRVNVGLPSSDRDMDPLDREVEASSDSEYLPAAIGPSHTPIRPFLPPAIAYSQAVRPLPPPPPSSTSRSNVPYLLRPSTSNPPLGYYTVSNPTAYPPAPTQPRAVDPTQSRSSILIRRVIIRGREGTVLVDRKWDLHQRVPVRPTPEPELASTPVLGEEYPTLSSDLLGSIVGRNTVGKGNEMRKDSVTKVMKGQKESEAEMKGKGTGKEKRERKETVVDRETLLNEDCVIGFGKGGKGGLRQIRSERGGTFREEEVVVGMRFFVSV